MEAIKAKLREASQKGQQTKTGGSSGGDKTAYPFWNIPQNSSALVRFLPDGDPENVFFWVKKETIKLPFDGSVGGEYATDRPVEVTVPSIDMFGMSCPISAHIRPWWKDEAKKPLARVYWKKPSFIFQGFVVQSPFEEEETPENPIRRFNLNRSLFEIIEQSLLNPDMEDSPVDYIAGRDFKINKTQKGDYANYSTSSWSFRSRSLNEQEAIAIEQFGLRDLKAELGVKPDGDGVEMIKAMFNDSLAGRPFDNEAYGHAFRAFQKRGDAGEDAAVTHARSLIAPATTSVQVPMQTAAPRTAAAAVVNQTYSAPVVEEEEAPEAYSAPAAAAPVAAPAGAPTNKPSAHEILERIRNRSNTGN